MAETPRMSTATSVSNIYHGMAAGGLSFDAQDVGASDFERRLNAGVQRQPIRGVPMAAQARRIVQVFIADSNENIPLDDCVLYKGEQKLTDATDQELFFELDIKSILDAHNAKRTKVVDKKVKDRTEYLDSAKVRDLKMVVVTVANL